MRNLYFALLALCADFSSQKHPNAPAEALAFLGKHDRISPVSWLFSTKNTNLQNVYIWFVQIVKNRGAEFVQDSASHIREAFFY